MTDRVALFDVTKLDSRVTRYVTEHPYPLLFATISGAHLYGFPSPDSDFDLRGSHILPLEKVVGLVQSDETIDRSTVDGGLEIDLVTHDVAKFFAMVLKKNGYVLEQIFSPLVLHTSPEHEELKEIALRCVTRHHAYHYKGFFHTQWDLFRKEEPPRAKPLLYVYRVLLTGIHLMRTGEVEANLLRLNEQARLPYIAELVELKLRGPEKGRVANIDLGFHERKTQRLLGVLEEASQKSHLPETPQAAAALNDLLVRLRLSGKVAAAWQLRELERRAANPDTMP